MKNILITGASGYIGRLVTLGLSKEKNFNPGIIVALDVRERPASFEELNNIIYIKSDIRDTSVADVMKKYGIDVVCHLASIVTPGKKSNREFEYSVDVLGTKNIVESCLKSGVKKIIITSSGAAYGYYPDNPEWICETDALRGNREFAYSDHKRIVEEMLADYRKKEPQLKQLIFRPSTVIGSTVRNQITDLFEKPMIIGIAGSKTPFVFIWDQDVVNCIIKGCAGDQSGIYNLAGDGAVPLKDIARILRKPFIPVPAKVLKGALSLLKKTGVSQYGPEQVAFLQYRALLYNGALKSEFQYIPEKTSMEAFLYYLEGKN